MPVATPEELLKYPPPPVPDWLRQLYEKTSDVILPPEFQVKFIKPGKGGAPGEPYWISNYGSQTWALLSPYDETVIGGSRGGAKSAALIAWFAMGDPRCAKNDPARYSYLLEPTYRGLMLRKEYQAMAEFVDEASDFFGPLGGKAKNEPVEFHFKNGAIIYTNHLGDKSAFEKYRGWGISRIGIEELTQIEEESWYLKLLGSLRAKKQVRIHGPNKFPALRSQILSTTNPDGLGKLWVKKRFVNVLNGRGERIPANTPMRDTFTGLSRIFIPMSRKDNPYLRDDKQYEGFLLSQDEVTRKQWMEGDWEAGAGVYFSEFRPHGPVGTRELEQFPWANHVITEAPLRPWWFRFGGGDWGYDHPATFHKGCRSEKDGRVHIYDELVLRGCGSFEMGVKLAHWWLPDLEFLPDKTVTVAFSPDAFSKTDDVKTKAEQVAEGIRSVLGPYGAFMLRYTDDERARMALDPAAAADIFARRVGTLPAGQLRIVLKQAHTDRVAGWSYMRDGLRFRPVVSETEAQLKERLQATYDRAGDRAVEAYERELSKVRRPIDEVLPRLQVWRNCPGLIRFLEEATRDEKKTEDVRKYDAVEGVGGDDPGDSARYLLMNLREVEKIMPRSYYISERMEHIQTEYEQNFGERLTDQNRLIMVQKTQAARYDNTVLKPASFTLPRAGSSRHRAYRVN